MQLTAQQGDMEYQFAAEEMHEAEVEAASNFYRAPCRFTDLRELHAINVHEQQ